MGISMHKTKSADKILKSFRVLSVFSMLFFDIQGIAISEQLSLESSKPNVIVILTDDQGYADLGVYGSADLRTPNIDQIAQRGARLLNFYAQPSCGPSRAALLTGSYPILVGEPANKKNPNTVLHQKEFTIAEMLQKVGYATALIGKWHLSNNATDPNTMGIDHFSGILGGGVSSYTNWKEVTNGIRVDNTTYTTTAFSSAAIAVSYTHLTLPTNREG